MKSEEIQQESNSRDKKLPTESYLLPCFLMKDDQRRCRDDDCLWCGGCVRRGDTRTVMLQISCHNYIAILMTWPAITTNLRQQTSMKS